MSITQVTYGTDGKPTAGFTAGVTDSPIESALVGATDETAPASDTAVSGLNGRLQRIAQNLSTLLAIFRAEDSAASDGHLGLPLLAQRQGTPANTSGTDGDYEMLRIDGGSLWAKLTSIIPGTASTNLGKAIDAVAGAADTGVAFLATRLDTLATLTPASGDYASPRVNARGALWTALDPNFAAVGGFTAVKDVTLTTDTAAYSAGDLIAETQVVSGAARITNGTGQITQIVVVDEADQKAQLTVYFLSANNTFGTENALPSISDANAGAILGRVRVEVADYDDLGGVSVAAIPCAIPFAAVSGTADLYVAVVNGAGAPTYGATSIKLRVGIQQD